MFAGNGPHNFDLTIVSHVEPFDLVKITESDYYLGYNNEAFNALYQQIRATPAEAERAKLLGDAQRMLPICEPEPRPTVPFSAKLKSNRVVVGANGATPQYTLQCKVANG